jgi:hypothetical protein
MLADGVVVVLDTILVLVTIECVTDATNFFDMHD